MISGRRQSKSQRFLVTAAGWAVGFLTIAFFIGGLTVICFPSRVEPNSFVGHHRLTMGWASLIVGTAALILTMSRWIGALPGLLAAATLSGLISLFQGHVINLPSKPISRVDALIATLLFLGSTVLSALTFKDRGLNVIDRVALLAVVSSLAWGLLTDSIRIAGVGTFICLLFTWAYSRIRRPPQDSVSES
jgi:hypothetical protein